MKYNQYQQYEIVTADSAEVLTDQLNQRLYKLRHKSPTVTFEGLIARISYAETEAQCEELMDEYQLKGVTLTCQDCPYFDPVKKEDGTPDRRSKLGDCPHTPQKRTYRYSLACNLLFEKINNGDVRLCLAEDKEDQCT